MSQQINLYNPLFLRKEKYFSARTMVQSLALIVIGLAALYAYAAMQTRELQRLADDYGRQLASQRDQLVKLGAQGASKLLESEVTRLEAETRSRRGMLDMVQGGEFGHAEGFSRYFAAFARNPMRGVWLTGFSVGEGGDLLRIRGRVLHPDLVPAYLKSLNQEDVMRGRLVTELKLAARDGSDARRPGADAAAAGPQRFVEFELLAPLRAAAPAKPAAKGGVR